eukprot:c17599_g1_i1 orf=327-1466(-)
MATGKLRVSAASARVHTRKSTESRKCCKCCHGAMPMFFLLALTIYFAWFYETLKPPPPKPCGTPLGMPVTSPRVKLHDGRYVAYKEGGMPKESATYKVVVVHGFAGSRKDLLNASKNLVEELGVYFVGFDRAGYGQSDVNPNRSIKSEAADIQELADLLNLGPKFYVIAYSIGGYSAWACLKYIPHRLAGVAMLAPVTNYWWSGISRAEAIQAYRLQPLQDQFAVAVSHYAPWLTYWWNTQNWFPKSSVIQGKLDYLNAVDKELMNMAAVTERRMEATQQSVYESLHRDMILMFGQWDFDPMGLQNPFPNREGSVHIWHGDEDYIVPVRLQRYLVRHLPWIHYHELPGIGHLLTFVEGLPDRILKDLLLGVDLLVEPSN